MEAHLLAIEGLVVLPTEPQQPVYTSSHRFPSSSKETKALNKNIVTMKETTPLGVVLSIGNLDDYELRKGPGNNRSNDGPSETFKHIFCFLSCFATLRVRQYAQGV